jgi:hypothetical protein
MPHLSDLYAAATADAARSQYLAAGEAVLAFFDGTAFLVNTSFGGLSPLFSSLLMMRGRTFSKAAAYAGIVTNGAVCLSFLPVISTILLFLSLPGYLIWNVQVARTLFGLTRRAADPAVGILA